MKFEGISQVLEDFVVVYLHEVLAKQELGGLGIFFSFNVVEFDVNFGLLVVRLGISARWIAALWVLQIRTCRVDKVLLIHEKTKQLLLLLVVLLPKLLVNHILDFEVVLLLGFRISVDFVLEVLDECLLEFEALHVGIGQFMHNVLLDFVNFLHFHAFQLRLAAQILILRAVTHS